MLYSKIQNNSSGLIKCLGGFSSIKPEGKFTLSTVTKHWFFPAFYDIPETEQEDF